MLDRRPSRFLLCIARMHHIDRPPPLPVYVARPWPATIAVVPITRNFHPCLRQHVLCEAACHCPIESRMDVLYTCTKVLFRKLVKLYPLGTFWDFGIVVQAGGVGFRRLFHRRIRIRRRICWCCLQGFLPKWGTLNTDRNIATDEDE